MMLQIQKIEMMKKLASISRVVFFFFSSMDDLALDDMELILGADMDVGVSNETHVADDKPLTFDGKMRERPI
jgi:hypothetical protein